MVLQAKGFPYPLIDLLGDQELVDTYRNGQFATLRLTSSMYHRFHAPYDCRVERVNYISGDTWNVNPIALAARRAAVLQERTRHHPLPPALRRSSSRSCRWRPSWSRASGCKFLDVRLHLNYRGPNVIPCDAPVRKGEEMGWFEHGSTIIVFAPQGVSLCGGIGEGGRVRMGEALMRLS